MKLCKIAVWVLLLMVFSSLAFAEDIKIIKEAPKSIKYGDVLTVKITVINNGDSSIEIALVETITNAQAIEPELIVPSIPQDIIAAIPPYFEWTLNVNPKTKKSIQYKIKPDSPGDYFLGATKGYVDDKIYYSNDFTVLVICNQNNRCEPELKENSKNCPKDCLSGTEDNTCDLSRDGFCDPDCEEGADMDCFCGNGKCEKFENHQTCYKDCRLSFWQALSNWIKSLFGIS